MEEKKRINLKNKLHSINPFSSNLIKPIPKKRTLILSSDLINKDIILNEDENSYENFLYVAMKPTKERNAKDLLVIKRRIINTDFYHKIKNESLDDFAIERVLFFCSLNLYYKNFSEDEFIYKEGDKLDDFLIVFRGKMKLVRLKSNLKSMNLEEYLYLLKDLNQKKLYELLHKTIKENISSFNLQNNSFQDIEEILFRIKLIKLSSNKSNINDFHKLFKNSIKEPQQYDIDLDELKKLEESSKEEFFEYLNLLISNLLNYKLLTTYKNSGEIDLLKKAIIIYSYEDLTIIGDGQFLGEDDSLDHHNDCQENSARVTEDIHLGYINKYLYKDFVNTELNKMKLKENMFIIDNYVFQSIKPGSFKKKFFHEFDLQEYQRGKLLYKENEYPNYIYFTREGEIDLTLKMSLLELNSIINSLKSKLNQYDLIKDEYQLQYDPVLEELNKKQIFRLFIFGKKRILGLNEYLYNLPTFYEASVISEKAKLYKLDISIFNRIFQEEKQCQYPIQKYVKNNLISILSRLIEIKSGYLRLYDKKINYQNKLKKLNNKQYHSNYRSNNSPNNSQIFISSEIYQLKCEQYRKKRNDTEYSKSVSFFKTSLDFEQLNIKKKLSKKRILDSQDKNLTGGIKSNLRTKFINSFNQNLNKNEDYLIERKVKTFLKSEISNFTVNDFLGSNRYSHSPFVKNNKTILLDKTTTHNKTTIDDYILKKYNESTYGTILPKVSLNNLNNDEENIITQERDLMKNKKPPKNNVRFFKIPFKKYIDKISNTGSKKTDNNIYDILPHRKEIELDTQNTFKHLFIIKTKSKERINRKINNLKLNKFF